MGLNRPTFRPRSSLNSPLAPRRVVEAGPVSEITAEGGDPAQAQIFDRLTGSVFTLLELRSRCLLARSLSPTTSSCVYFRDAPALVHRAASSTIARPRAELARYTLVENRSVGRVCRVDNARSTPSVFLPAC